MFDARFTRLAAAASRAARAPMHVGLVGALVLGAVAATAGGCGGDDDDRGPERSTPPDGADAASSSSGLGCDVLALVESRCASCHADGSAFGALASLEALRAPSAAAPSETMAQRSLARMVDEALPMPPAPSAPATDAEVGLLSAWIDEGMPACGADSAPTYTHPNQIPQDELFRCSEPVPQSSPARLRRIGRDEWAKHFQLTFWRDPPRWRAGAPFEHDVDDLYTTYGDTETLDDATLELYIDPVQLGEAGTNVAGYIKTIADNDDPSLQCFYATATSPDDACVRRFTRALLRRAVVFRDPSEPEVERLAAYARAALSRETPPVTRAQTVAEIASAGWLSSGALFRSELGGPGGRAELSKWELAQAFAMIVGHRLPSAPRINMRFASVPGVTEGYVVGLDGYLADVADAAEDGTIGDPKVLDQLFRKHGAGQSSERYDIGDEVEAQERSKHSPYWLSSRVRGFFREWLGYESFYYAFKEQPAFTSKYQQTGTASIYSALVRGYDGIRQESSQEPEPTMVRLLDNTIARIVVEDRDVLRTLLTTRRFYLRSRTTGSAPTPFGVDAAIPDDRDARWVTMPASERAGVLTHPAWLGAHAGSFDDDPSLVERGKWVRENLLCQYVPPLSEVKGAAMVGESSPTLTARARVDAATSSAGCQQCHRLMNSLGYPFEIYNQAGFLRAVDHDGSAPNGSSLLVDMPDPSLDGPVRDAVELSEKLAASNHTKRCFVRQTFRYFAGRDERLADACTLARMEQAYDARGSFLEMVSSFVTSDAFRFRQK